MGALAGIALVLVVLLLSHRFGRAEPTGVYRPDIPADALESGCFPLPGDVIFDFAYQIRRDGDFEINGEERRIVQGQYDEIDEPEALAAIVADFVEAGFVASDRPGPYDAVLSRTGPRATSYESLVTQLAGIEQDTIVRGSFVLELPLAEAPPPTREVCDDPAVTKRWVLPSWDDLMVTRLAALAPRADVILVWLLLGHVVLKLLIYPLTMHAPPYNDEQQYYDGARALSNLVRDVGSFTAPDGAELERNVVGSGWFMPGMAIVMAPLFVVFPDAADPLCRAYLGLANLLVLLWAVRSVRQPARHRIRRPPRRLPRPAAGLGLHVLHVVRRPAQRPGADRARRARRRHAAASSALASPRR